MSGVKFNPIGLNETFETRVPDVPSAVMTLDYFC
jgi:hypothetical protein